MTGCQGRQLDSPRVDDNQRRAPPDRLLDAGADDRMVLRRVRAADEDRPGDFDVVERVRAEACAERVLQRRGAWRMTDARAAIDVVGAQHDARELLREVVLLVGRARRSQHADAVGSVAGHQIAKPRRCERQGLVPRGAPPLAAGANHRIQNAIVGANELERVPAFHAEMALVHRCIQHRLDGDYPAVPRAD